MTTLLKRKPQISPTLGGRSLANFIDEGAVFIAKLLTTT